VLSLEERTVLSRVDFVAMPCHLEGRLALLVLDILRGHTHCESEAYPYVVSKKTQRTGSSIWSSNNVDAWAYTVKNV
jgi:hypothetical protein